MEQLTPNVFTETKTLGCNPSFVVTTEGVVMIDSPQQPSDAIRWRDEIARHGPVRYLINTEPHPDHILGNWFFPTTVVAQEQTRESIIHPEMHEDMVKWIRDQGAPDPRTQPKSGGPMGRFLERFKQTDPEGIKYLEGYQLRAPSVTFGNKMTLYVGRHSFELIHLPGHTLGETAVLVPEERVVFTGDNVVNNVMLLLQDKNLVFIWLESLQKIAELDVDYVVPGHGDVGDKEAIRQMSSLLQEIVGAVQKCIDAGWTREETVAKISFADRFPVSAGMEFMAPFWQIRNIGWTYDELVARKR